MTPEEIVGLIGNIANRPDMREVQAKQIREIKNLLAGQLTTIADFLEEARDNLLDLEEVPETSSGDELSEKEIADLLMIAHPKKKKKTQRMTDEALISAEKAQDNSNDIYKVSARIKNSARGAVKGNLTAQGDMVVNMFTHMIKAMYDFAETLPDDNSRNRLNQLVRKQEELPGSLIAALGAGVRLK